MEDTATEATVTEATATEAVQTKPMAKLSKKTIELLVEYAGCQDVHSTLNITFKELLDYVWARIMRHPARDEIIKILDSEMQESECKCFTGRISRLVNCLNGFYDDVKINISEKEQIGNIIIAIKNSLNIDPSDENFVNIWKEKFRKEMEERGYDEETIKQWEEHIE